MNTAPLLPVFLKMQDRPCLVVGAGRIAFEKIGVLLECGARLRVVAPAATTEVTALAAKGTLVWLRREYSAADLAGASLVIAATGDSAVNARVRADAEGLGLLVNAVDDPRSCDFYFGSIVRRGDLQIGISTAGESPAFAQQLKQEIDAALPSDTGEWLAHLGEVRRHVNRVMEPGPARISLLRELARREACDPDTCPCRALV